RVFDAAEARTLTSARAPAETVAAQTTRAEGIEARADARGISTIYGETSSSALPTFTLEADCDDSNICTITEPTTGLSETIDLADFSVIVDHDRAVLTKHGVTLLEGRGGDGGPDYRIYGTWMDHAGFAVETGASGQVNGVTITLRGAQAFGDAAESNPAADATWRGLMVGTPTRGARRDNLLQGDVELTFTAADNMVDATFSDIKDLDRNAPHTVTEVRFMNVPVTDGGYTDGTRGSGTWIEGAFGGPNHEETAGVFEQQDIVGAYGAKKE
ncbi:MAG: hypothetical protein GDA53_00775, partial [Rhodobacteraceae bacterium]|nr:hypothetical protein [Paracoccaceae bacterium]